MVVIVCSVEKSQYKIHSEGICRLCISNEDCAENWPSGHDIVEYCKDMFVCQSLNTPNYTKDFCCFERYYTCKGKDTICV